MKRVALKQRKGKDFVFSLFYFIVFYTTQEVHFFIYYIYIYIHDFSNCSTVFDLHRFADDSNLFLAASSLECSETRVNQELKHVHDWFCANRLSLNIDQTTFFVFHPFRKN